MRTGEEVTVLIAKAEDDDNNLHGMTYAQGIVDALDWAFHDGDDPFEVEG